MTKEVIKRYRMSKPYLLEVLDDYNEIERNITSIISASGYKMQFIAEKLNLPMSTLYFKRKTGWRLGEAAADTTRSMGYCRRCAKPSLAAMQGRQYNWTMK